MESTKYKIFFHQGDELTLKTRVLRGHARLQGGDLHIEGPAGELWVLSSDILKVEIFRLHGLGRVIRLDHRNGRLFLSVVRFMIGQFATINFFKTGRLHTELSAIAGGNLK